jgi:hypothetical protein
MQQRQQPIIKSHRFARITLWAKAMLAWLALALFSETRVSRRHVRQRYGFLSLAWMERLVGSLALIRAVELANLPCINRPPPRNTAPAGCVRRTPRAGAHRAILGARFRKALKHRDRIQHFERLCAALSDIDAFARRNLVKRMRRRLTKRRAVIMSAPPADPVASLAFTAPGAADTS